MFGERVFDHAVVLFTWGDQLDEDQTIEKYVGQSERLKELVQKCGGRCHVLDNKRWKEQQRDEDEEEEEEEKGDEYRSNRVQVENLLSTVEQMACQGSFYTPDMLQPATTASVVPTTTNGTSNGAAEKIEAQKKVAVQGALNLNKKRVPCFACFGRK